MKSLRIGCIGVIVFGCAAANAATLASTFDTSGEGWQRVHLANSGSVTDIVSGPTTNLAWRSTGGNPGGNIYVSDTVQDSLGWFSAPARFLGDQSGRYGEAIRWDQSYSYTGTASSTNNYVPDIALVGGGLAIVADAGVAANLMNTWAPFRVELRETNWHINFMTNRAPSEAEFKSVLSNLQHLYVRAEYIGGSDTGYLDNFQMTASDCPPCSIRVSEVEVCWQSQSNRQYRVDYRSAFEATNTWVPVQANIIPGDGQVICIYDKVPRESSRRFYRVVCDP